jgi:UDP-perosamine 4-acetyltransferase
MADGPVVILGAGGHAKVVVELLRACGQTIVGLLDADPTPRQVLGVDVIGDDLRLAGLRRDGVAHAFVALGDNRLRAEVGRRLGELGFELVNAVSPQAIVSPSVRLGAGVAIMAGAVINAEGRIDDLAIINTGAAIDHDAWIGEAAHVAPGSALAGNVTVGRRAFLGIGCSVVPGVNIGDDAIVGAGACVLRDVEAATTAVGVPAQPRRPR